MIAALYIDPRGPYPKMEGWLQKSTAPAVPVVDCWDEARDARLYDGPFPVVAHPPCRHWGRLRHQARVTCADCGWYGSRGRFNVHANPLNLLCGGQILSDEDCAIRAVEQVRRCGGVLEHPAYSGVWDGPRPPSGAPMPPPIAECERCGSCADAWSACDCGFTVEQRDPHGGYTVEVNQVAWGHVAHKRTWLYLVGVPRDSLEKPPFPGRKPTHRIGSSTCGRVDGTRYRPASGLKSASALDRRLTPPLFAEYLARLAQSARSY